MQQLIIYLLISLVLPLLAKAPLAFAQFKAGGYDNKHPRNQQAQLTGFGARALAAHQNTFESIIIFAPCILVAIATRTATDNVLLGAQLFLVSRIVYVALYLANIDILRSLVWGVGLLASLSIPWQVMQQL